jgi:hypothetical protein
MPPKKTSARLDITLPISLAERLRAHADREGTTVSSVISQAVRGYLDGGAPSPSVMRGQRMIEEEEVKAIGRTTILEFFNSSEGEKYLIDRATETLQRMSQEEQRRVLIGLGWTIPESASGDQIPQPVRPPVPETITITKRPPVHTGKIPVPEHIRKAITENGYTAAQIANVILAIFNPNRDPAIRTITRGTLQGFAKGTATMTSPEYCEQIVRAVEYLESQRKDHPDLSGFN